MNTYQNNYRKNVRSFANPISFGKSSLIHLDSNSETNPIRQLPATNIPCFQFNSTHDLAKHVASTITNIVNERRGLGQKAVLALPGGSTPTTVYRELIRLHQEEGVDFSSVVAFSIDEYVGIPQTKLQNLQRWMREHLYNHINIPSDQIFFLDGMAPVEKLETVCKEYEALIQDHGGIDLAILGVGGNGRIGFNEPFSIRQSRTRLCTLDPVTVRSASSDFFGEKNVPTQGLTMGLGTLLDARKVLLLALGEHKANVIKETAEGSITDRVPSSFLQDHNDAQIYVDSASGKALSACETPWVLGNVAWDDLLIKRAMLWLCDQTNKALLKLDDDDLREHNLHQLLRHHGPAQRVAHKIFKALEGTIEYHPSGKEKKRVICFSPHPDDDVISMGGTLIRLNEDQHEVHIAYMTSGNIAVFDHDARRIADMVTEYNRLFGIDTDRSTAVESQVNQSLDQKKQGEPDIDEVRKIKALIRWSEAKAGAIAVGCDEDNCHFLDLPFYRTGTIDKKPWGVEDVEIIEKLIRDIEPHEIYVAGDLSDPHGTHRVCAEAIFATLDKLKDEGAAVPDVLLYRGAWQEYELHEIEIAVPLSPRDMQIKKKAIFMHESQKDEALFPGSDPREFWQRAEDRNTGTADKYNRIGLPEYFAMEAFVKWNGHPI